MIGIIVQERFYYLGEGDLYRAFFDNIAYHLEKNKWGRKYPIVMKQFYYGRVFKKDIIELAKEFVDINRKFEKLKPSDIVWDRNNLDIKPPWGDDISDDVTNLANYFITVDGREFFEVIFGAIEDAIDSKCDITLDNI